MRGSAAQITDDEINTSYVWDDTNRMSSTTDDAGKTSTYTYDALNRPLTLTYPDASVETMAFDDEGNMTSRTDRNGSVVAYTYDVLNRPTQVDATPVTNITTPGNNTTDVVGTTQQTFKYDGLGRVLEATDNNEPYDPNDDAKCEYDYDSLSRITEERQIFGGDSKKVQYTWASSGRLLTANYQGPNKIDYSYDSLDRIVAMDWNKASNHAGAHDAEYEYIGGRTLERKVLNNVTRSLIDPNTATKSAYDGIGRPAHINYGGGNLTFGYDAASNELFEYDSVSLGTLQSAGRWLETYEYDAAYRLTSYKAGTDGNSAPTPPTLPTATTSAGSTRINAQGLATLPAPTTPATQERTWDLDGVGNWDSFSVNGVTHTSAQTNAHALTAFQGSTLDSLPGGETYLDAPFDTTSGTHAFNYHFDAFGRLQEVTDPANNDRIVAEYDYDASGRRVAREADTDHDGVIDEEVRYIYDGQQVVEERDLNAPSTITRCNVWGLYVDALLWSDSSVGERIFSYNKAHRA